MNRRARLVVCGLAAVVALADPAAAQTGDVPTKVPASGDVPLKKLTSPDQVPRRGFNIVLLLGDMQGGDAQENIPPAARKALADMKDFLPYRNYRLLDTQWIIGGNAAAFTRLRGVDDQEYELELRAAPAFQAGAPTLSPTGIAVRFLLRDASDLTTPFATDSSRSPLHPKELAKADTASVEISREIFQLERERDDLQLQVSKGRKQSEVGIKDPDEVKRLETQLAAVTRRIAELKQSVATASAKAAGRTVIDTSFRMDDGETVVVGTSKVKGGGKALIALLTATADRSKGSTK